MQTSAKMTILNAKERQTMLLALRVARRHLESLIETATDVDGITADREYAPEVAVWRRQLAQIHRLEQSAKLRKPRRRAARVRAAPSLRS